MASGRKRKPFGSKYVNNKGYLFVYLPDHHRANNRGYVWYHYIVVEKEVGRLLKDNEFVHHIDGDKANNSPDNLLIVESMSEHNKIHNQLRKLTYKLIKKGTIKFNKDKKEYY